MAASHNIRRCSVVAWLCLLVALTIFAVAGWLQSRITETYQYIVPVAGEGEDPAELYRSMMETLSREGAENAVVFGRKQRTELTTAFGTEEVTTYLIDGQWKEAHHETLSEGRYITDYDVEKNIRCAVIPESLARVCVPSGEVLGASVTIAGQDFEVVGVIRDRVRFGESDVNILYIPCMSDSIPVDTITVGLHGNDAQSKPASVWKSLFQSAFPGGTFHDLRQDCFSAWLPAYMLLLCGMFALFFRFTRKYLSGIRKTISVYRVETSNHNDRHKSWKSTVLHGLFAVLTGVILLTGWFVFLKLFVYPMSIFPEYVPTEPAKLSSWRESLLLVLRRSTASISCTSAETGLIGITGRLIVLGSLVGLVGIIEITHIHAKQ